MCEWLLKNGADPNAQLTGLEDRLQPDFQDSGFIGLDATYHDKCTPLHVAVFYKNVETMKILAQQSHVDVNAVDSESYTPLVYALCGGENGGSYDILECLTVREDLEINNQYRFPLNQLIPINKFGLEYRERYPQRYYMALELWQNAFNLRPIHLVALDLDARSMEILDRHGNLLVSEPTQDGITALMIATWAKKVPYSVAAMQRLLGYPGNKLDVQDNLKRTALMHAIEYNTMDLEPVRLLIHAGAKLDLQNNKGHTVLMLAIKQKYDLEVSGLVEVILENEDKGLNVNAKDIENGRSALMMAACPNYRNSNQILPVDVLHVSRLLKVEGIDPHAVDNDGRSALDLAREQMETDKSRSAETQQELEEEDLFGVHLANFAERACYLRLEHESTQKSESDAITRRAKLDLIKWKKTQIEDLEKFQELIRLRQEIVALLENATTKAEG